MAKPGLSCGSRVRAKHAKPRLKLYHAWLVKTRAAVPDGTGTAKAIDYTLNRWPALSRYADSGHLPIDNNPVENAIRPIAIGKWMRRRRSFCLVFRVFHLSTGINDKENIFKSFHLVRGQLLHLFVRFSSKKGAGAAPVNVSSRCCSQFRRCPSRFALSRIGH